MFFYVHSNLRTATRPLGPEKVVIVHKKLLQGMSGQFQQCVYVVLHVAYHLEELDIMEANPRVTINSKIVQNQLVGTATSTYWPKQKAAPVGEDEDHHETQGAVGEMYTGHLATVFLVFNEGRSYFPELHPKNIFFNDYDLVFYASAENKLIFKENYVLQWGILSKNLQPKHCFPSPIHSQHNDNSAIPMDTCNNTNSSAFWKNFEHYDRWKKALCKGQIEWLWKKLFI